MRKILAIDQGTTLTKAYLLDEAGGFTEVGRLPHQTMHPQAGWVEQDAEALLHNIQTLIRMAGKFDALALAHQGETVVASDAETGLPLYPAIVWQDQRTQAWLEEERLKGLEQETLSRAGLPLDAYFSASKLRWLFHEVPAVKAAYQANRLRLSTSDAFFVSRLTGHYSTDTSSASRTSLANLHTANWDDHLCDRFGVPTATLPTIRPTVADFGRLSIGSESDGAPLVAVVVDQQAALFGHQCQQAGDMKITFGTGAFALALTGEKPHLHAGDGLLPTLAWTLPSRAGGVVNTTYAVDGGMYTAGAAIEWLKGLGLFSDYAELSTYQGPSALARGLVFVPALAGLACPYWDRHAAGQWMGMRQDTTKADLCRAVVEGIALRAAEIVDTLSAIQPHLGQLSIDGGITKNPYFCQFFTDLLQRPVTVFSHADITSLGTARLGSLALDSAAFQPAELLQQVYQPGAPTLAALRPRFHQALNMCRGWFSS
ncbi:hypothetical protein LIN78_04850 [Leeia sp. TBRC 13508]|uniref:ATP:glycerol 3-phosphotransferase n=1 Tax=Leeia speluncae TaxID=2884804 RepID=A0ABS8D4F8_9NEIS|nr:FGGY family carbohydrate kinase [Leeia speluncae]MCB6182878.1 hypothetical protein [Leeia speluncae]